METEFKITTLRECANDELIEKVNALTEPLQINLVNRLLDKTFGELSYLDSTFLRDILKLDLNLLALNFNK
jgi:hypothetical protein